ncbi:MAG: ATP-binding cassette domain-containing protein [bacterium]
MNAIEIINLTKKFDDLVAVDGINLTINKGEIFGLLGPNGAGKTTTLMILSTLLKPTSGDATVNNFSVLGDSSKVRSSIGIVFQDPSSDDTLTGYENLKLHALLYDLPMKAIDEKIDAVLDLVDMKDRKNDVVKNYSGGMRRRMEIARGLLHEPEILFLDEPTLGLDPQTRAKIWQYIEALAKKKKMTIILTTHYMEEADKLCNRIAIIDHGKIVALDTPANLKQKIGGDVVTLSGKNLNIDELSKLLFVKHIEKIDGHYRFSIENYRKNLQKLLLVAGEIDSVEARSPDLNDVFLHYTGKEIRESSTSPVERLRIINKVK